MKNDKSQGNDMVVKMIKAIIFGTITGAVICTLMLLAASFIFVKMQSVPEAAIIPVAIFIVCAASFVGGYFSARIKKSMGMLIGSITALFIFVVLILIGMGFSESGFSIISLLRMALMIISGAIGGILGVNKRKHRK